MSKVDELIQDLCPDGVERVALGDPMVSSAIYSGGTPSKSRSEYWEGGTIPWMSSGEVNKETVFQTDTFITQEGLDGSSAKMVPPVSVIVALAGQGKTRGKVARNQIELCTNQSLASIIPGENLNRDFLYHFLKGEYENLRAISSSDGSRGGLTLKMIKGYEIPLPPLEVQEEIVRILDQFVELDRELEQEIVVREKQLESVFRNLSDISADKSARLGDIAERRKGMSVTAAKMKELSAKPGDVRIFAGGQTMVDVDESAIPSGKILEGPAIIVKSRGYIDFVFHESRYTHKSEMWSYCVNEDRVSQKYVFYYLVSQKFNLQEFARATSVKLPQLSVGDTDNLKIPLPPLEVQEEIAIKLDTFTEYIDDLKREHELRQKQYEYYRDQLLDFDVKE